MLAAIFDLFFFTFLMKKKGSSVQTKMITAEAAILVCLMCCVDLQVYCRDLERDRIHVFDLLSDGRHTVHVGCRSAQSKSTRPESKRLIMILSLKNDVVIPHRG